MKRHLRKKEENIKKDLEHFKKVRAEHRKSRIRKGLATV
jgi:50S ribosomal subunit-associated GTPase HflX